MEKIAFFFLILLSLCITSCSTNEDELVSKPITGNYTFSFICYEEVIELLKVELLDTNNNVISTKQYYNVLEDQTINYSFNTGNKIKIKVNDEDYFHTFYVIKKNNVILYDSVLDGYIYNDITKQL